MQSQITDGRWNTKKSYWSQNYQDIEGVSIGQKYQQRNVFTSNGDNNKKISLKLVKFQKRYLENNLFKSLSFRQNTLRKPVEKLSFSDVAGLKSVTLLKKMNPFTMNPFLPSF